MKITTPALLSFGTKRAFLRVTLGAHRPTHFPSFPPPAAVPTWLHGRNPSFQIDVLSLQPEQFAPAQAGGQFDVVQLKNSAFFRLPKNAAIAGRHPWPTGQAGEVVETSEEEFEYFLGEFVALFKAKRAEMVEITVLL